MKLAKLTLLLPLLCLCACGNDSAISPSSNSPTDDSSIADTSLAESVSPEPSSTETSRNIYTIYFSATSNTEGIATIIADYTSSSLYEILAADPYTSEDLNYNDSDCRANQEQNDATSRPALSSSTIDISSYQVFFLGYPIWWGKAPKIIYTFLESYDFANKTIIPFCTSASSSISGSESDLHDLEPNATWLSGRRFSASASRETVTSWIDSLDC